MFAPLTVGCICGCKRMATGPRKLHKNCYNLLRAEIAAGKLTWAEAEEQGRCDRVAKVKAWSKWNMDVVPPRPAPLRERR